MGSAGPCVGLRVWAPVLQLAKRAGMPELVAQHVSIGEQGGANADLEVPASVVGMAAGADSVDDTGCWSTWLGGP